MFRFLREKVQLKQQKYSQEIVWLVSQTAHMQNMATERKIIINRLKPKPKLEKRLLNWQDQKSRAKKSRINLILVKQDQRSRAEDLTILEGYSFS